jgi:hypothetical protein
MENPTSEITLRPIESQICTWFREKLSLTQPDRLKRMPKLRRQVLWIWAQLPPRNPLLAHLKLLFRPPRMSKQYQKRQSRDAALGVPSHSLHLAQSFSDTTGQVR